ncbi:GDSL esterase/lipase At5g03980-like [Ananas comosus]|uniref:GDSL esterase/lipase At5g03980-like n=1 Tax=Ananas comosus TaxID=4615 RepID=A0A6P5FCU8_ANACO|nr:GDSL esterase/lipase At5g03980-like [Ananas comosus]
MALPKCISLLLFIVLLISSRAVAVSSSSSSSSSSGDNDCGIKAVYSFGDSIADTGNLLREGVDNTSFSSIARLPYGETTFGYPTGRCSNGLLMIDFIAKDLGLPYLNPYLEKDANFTYGVNFAVAGATALDASFFAEKGMMIPFTNSSLHVQLGWFKSHLKTICSSEEDCGERMRHALFMVGEIGGNDYNYAFFGKKPIQEVATIVPYVVGSIITAAKELLDMGAVRLVIPGNFPIGCIPAYLTLVNSVNPSAYDENDCLIDLNTFAMLHNVKLQKAIEVLRLLYPNAVIAYADYFRAFLYILNNADKLEHTCKFDLFMFNALITDCFEGFNKKFLHQACCGGGGGYNFDAAAMCGAPGTSVDRNPSSFVSWDGIHLTQEAYRIMEKQLFGGGYTYPSIELTKLAKCQ